MVAILTQSKELLEESGKDLPDAWLFSDDEVHASAWPILFLKSAWRYWQHAFFEFSLAPSCRYEIAEFPFEQLE